MYGIKETEDVIKFLGDLAKAIKEAKADGKLDIFDAVKLLSISPSLASAVAGAHNIDEELSDLSIEEKEKLISQLQQVLFKFVEALT